MNIHEHQAKELLSLFGVPVPKGVVIYNLKEIISIYTQRADRLEMKITALLSSIDN